MARLVSGQELLIWAPGSFSLRNQVIATGLSGQGAVGGERVEPTLNCVLAPIS